MRFPVFDRLSELKRWVAGGRIALLVECGLLASGPGEALARIKDRFGCPPSEDGENIRGIRAIRRWIQKKDAAECLVHSLAIAAPHLHWAPDKAIIEVFDGRKYVLGPTQRVNEPLVPISFVFSASGPIAYEWADSSVGLRLRELQSIWSKIDKMNSDFHEFKWPLGITINHRYKKLFEVAIISTAEYLCRDRFCENGNGESLAAIVPEYEYIYSGSHGKVNLETVAWSAFLDPNPKLTRLERATHRKISAIVNGLPNNRARVRFLDELRLALT